MHARQERSIPRAPQEIADFQKREIRVTHDSYVRRTARYHESQGKPIALSWSLPFLSQFLYIGCIDKRAC